MEETVIFHHLEINKKTSFHQVNLYFWFILPEANFKSCSVAEMSQVVMQDVDM